MLIHMLLVDVQGNILNNKVHFAILQEDGLFIRLMLDVSTCDSILLLTSIGV